MSYLVPRKGEDTIENNIEQLKESVKVRDMMGGAFWWNIINDESVILANRIVSMGGDKEEVHNIVGKQNMQ